MKRRQRNAKVVAYLTLVLAIMMKYQNCAPLKPVTSGSRFLPSDRVGIIENFDKASTLTFLEPQVEVSNYYLSTYVSGTCEMGQAGAVLAWDISRELSGESQGAGSTKCEGGRFFVPIFMESLECNSVYNIRAELEFDNGTQTQITKRCPVEIQEIIDQRRAQIDLNCFYEVYDEVTCKKSCYQEGRLFSEEQISCSN